MSDALPFGKVILSCDTNPKFYDFWPIVRRAWQKLFGVEAYLVLVLTDKDWPAFKGGDHIYALAAADNIPIANQAKVARYYFAALLQDETAVLLNDVDLLPLNRDYVLKLLADRPKDTLLTLGSELYVGPEAGKFMAGYLMAEPAVFRKLVNPLGLSWSYWVRGLRGIKKFDNKEDITLAVNSESPDCFSDESLLRYFLSVHPVMTTHRRMPFWPYTVGALDRADWKFDLEKLERGDYKEAHLPRPLKDHLAKIQPLIDYIERQ